MRNGKRNVIEAHFKVKLSGEKATRQSVTGPGAFSVTDNKIVSEGFYIASAAHFVAGSRTHTLSSSSSVHENGKNAARRFSVLDEHLP